MARAHQRALEAPVSFLPATLFGDFVCFSFTIAAACQTADVARSNSVGFEPCAFVPNNLGHFPGLLEIDRIMFRP
jgi:hypothetical protein